MSVDQMIAAHPHPTSVNREALLRVIAEASDCTVTCTSCADASLAEPDVTEMRRCIRLCLDCSDICSATVRVVSRQTAVEPGILHTTVGLCAVACRASAEECERHASHHEHCRICGEICRRCEKACEALLDSLG